MKNFANAAKALTIFFTIIIIVCCFIYNYNTSAVSNNDEIKVFIVEENETFSTIASSLKENNLIRSDLFYKLYVKINNPKGLQAGSYELRENMSVKEIINVLEKGSTYNPDVIKITFPEGKQMLQIAEIIADNTNNSEQDVLLLVKDNKYISELIEKYWFLDEEILDSNIYYPLEGYLFPDTYEFMNKDVDIKSIFETMLNQTEKKLNIIKNELNKSEYSIHEIITLASMIQSEGNNIDDFKNMASIFITRLNKGMRLQSCATSYYGDHKIMGRDDFGDSYLSKNNYNTYVIDKLPVGPISNPGIDAIEAVLEPSNNEYLYFASDKNLKVYFSKTLEEHEKIIAKLQNAGNWYGS